MSSHEIEEAHIKSVYAKRQRSIPKGRYSHFNSGHLFLVQERERRFLALFDKYHCRSLVLKLILEVGCGTGFWLREFVKWGARPENITGVDLLPDRIDEAKKLCPGTAKIQCGDASKLAFPDATFHIVLQSTVFTSVLNDNLKRQIASEMLRVVKPDGLILWYDYHINNPRNHDVRAVKKQEIFQLFPNCRIDLQRITLAPPLSRLLAPYSWGVCYFLEKLKVFNTHYLAVIRKRES